MDRIVFSHNKDSWETPTDFFNELNKEFSFTLDAAATINNAKCLNWLEDALNVYWSGRVFCNPPYSKWQKFVEKAFEEYYSGRTELIVLLLPARTDTKAFHKYIYPFYSEVRFLKGRLKFEINGKPVLDRHGRPQSAPFPSMLVIFRPNKGLTGK